MLAGEGAGLVHRAAGIFRQAQAAERQRHALPEFLALDVDELERAAAEVAGDAIRCVEATDDAERGELRFFFARENADLTLQDGFGAVNEIGAVRRLARGSRGQHVHCRGAGLIRQCLETMQGCQGTFDAGLIHLAGQRDAFAETAEDLFVEKDRRRTRQAFIDDDADRIRPDIDNGDRGNPWKAPLGF
jgi:hypothetical protein